MHKINSVTSLRAAILQLDGKQTEEGIILRKQFHLAYESIKPINLIKSTFNEAAESQDLKDNILNTAVGLTVGYLSQTLFVSASNSPLKKLIGAALLFGITNVVAKNPEVVKAIGKRVLRIIRSKPGGRVNGAGNNEIEETAS